MNESNQAIFKDEQDYNERIGELRSKSDAHELEIIKINEQLALIGSKVSETQDRVSVPSAVGLMVRSGEIDNIVDIEYFEDALDGRIDMIDKKRDYLTNLSESLQADKNNIENHIAVLETQKLAAELQKKELVAKKRSELMISAGKLGSLESQISRVKKKLNEFYNNNECSPDDYDVLLTKLNELILKRSGLISDLNEKKFHYSTAKKTDIFLADYLNSLYGGIKDPEKEERLTNAYQEAREMLGDSRAEQLPIDILHGTHEVEKQIQRNGHVKIRRSFFAEKIGPIMKRALNVADNLAHHPNFSKQVGVLSGIFAVGIAGTGVVKTLNNSPENGQLQKPVDKIQSFSNLFPDSPGEGLFNDNLDKTQSSPKKTSPGETYHIGPKNWGGNMHSEKVDPVVVKLPNEYWEQASNQKSNDTLSNSGNENNISFDSSTVNYLGSISEIPSDKINSLLVATGNKYGIPIDLIMGICDNPQSLDNLVAIIKNNEQNIIVDDNQPQFAPDFDQIIFDSLRQFLSEKANSNVSSINPIEERYE